MGPSKLEETPEIEMEHTSFALLQLFPPYTLKIIFGRRSEVCVPGLLGICPYNL